MSLFLTRGPAIHRAWALVTFWALLTLWNLHSRGRGLWLARLRELPAGRAFRYRALLFGLLAGYWMLLAPGLTSLFGRLRDQPLAQWGAVVQDSLGVWSQGAALAITGWLLQPLVWILQPIFGAASRENGVGGEDDGAHPQA